jgi:hypothetical protein
MSAAVMPAPARIQGMPREGPATLLASTMRWRMPGRAEPAADDGLGAP